MNNIGEYILIAVLLVVLIALFVISYMRRKKYNTSLNQLRDELKKGDKVMTDSGVVGTVQEIYTEEEYKYVVLKSGKGNSVGYFTVHANSIYYVYDKENTNKSKNEEPVQTKPEEKVEPADKKTNKSNKKETKTADVVVEVNDESK